MKKLLQAAPVLAAALVLALLIGSCGGKGDNAAERAKKEILDALVLPPDAKLRDLKPNPEQNMLILSFGTKEKIDVMGGLLQKGIADRGYNLVSNTDGMISYKDQGGRQVTVMWFARDPDLSEFPTVFHVSVQPLPPELKDAAPAPAAEPAGETK